MVFEPASHHEILVLLVQLTALLITARLLGELSQRVGQPSVVGEILAGIVLGPSFLSGLFPIVDKWMIPHTEVGGYLLELIGMLGVMFLLLITGLETDLLLIRNQARSAIGVALGGLVIPLLFGFGLGMFLPAAYLVESDDRFVLSLFLAIAMAISALPVIAKVLMDLNLTRRNIAQTIIASAMIDDATGWILISVVIGLASSGTVTLLGIAESIAAVLGLMLVSATIGVWLVRHSLDWVQNSVRSRDKILTLVIILTFFWGVISQALHLEALLGAFFMGIILSRMPTLDTHVVHQIESLTLGIFAPIFFAIAGLKVNIVHLVTDGQTLSIMILIIGIAVVCKVIGAYIGARYLAGLDHWTGLFFGAGLNARGSMGIIVATIGLSLNLLTQDMFSIIVVMAVVTSLMAPAGLRYALARIPLNEAEETRLKREALDKENILANVNKILLPIRTRPTHEISGVQQIEIRLLERVRNQLNLNATLFTVSEQGKEGDSQTFLEHISQAFPQRQLSKRVVVGDRAGDLILDEAKRGYDLMFLGASESPDDANHLFSSIIDKLIRLSPCPTIIIHSRQRKLPENWQPSRILVPVTGSNRGRNAAQLAFALASNQEQHEVMILNVVELSANRLGSTQTNDRQRQISRQIVTELSDIGRLFGANSLGRVETGNTPEMMILDVARKSDFDLIILGTHIRPASEELYLGPRVERILNNAPCPVMIFNTADSI